MLSLLNKLVQAVLYALDLASGDASLEQLVDTEGLLLRAFHKAHHRQGPADMNPLYRLVHTPLVGRQASVGMRIWHFGLLAPEPRGAGSAIEHIPLICGRRLSLTAPAYHGSALCPHRRQVFGLAWAVGRSQSPKSGQSSLSLVDVRAELAKLRDAYEERTFGDRFHTKSSDCIREIYGPFTAKDFNSQSAMRVFFAHRQNLLYELIHWQVRRTQTKEGNTQ